MENNGRGFIGGLVTLILGVVGTAFSVITISSDMTGNGIIRFTYKSPFTGREVTMITILVISIIVTIVGIILLLKSKK